MFSYRLLSLRETQMYLTDFYPYLGFPQYGTMLYV
jgi:hypothetical protein